MTRVSKAPKDLIAKVQPVDERLDGPSKDACDWNRQLNYFSKTRTPAWDYGTAMYHVTVHSDEYHGGVVEAPRSEEEMEEDEDERADPDGQQPGSNTRSHGAPLTRSHSQAHSMGGHHHPHAQPYHNQANSMTPTMHQRPGPGYAYPSHPQGYPQPGHPGATSPQMFYQNPTGYLHQQQRASVSPQMHHQPLYAQHQAYPGPGGHYSQPMGSNPTAPGYAYNYPYGTPGGPPGYAAPSPGTVHAGGSPHTTTNPVLANSSSTSSGTLPGGGEGHSTPGNAADPPGGRERRSTRSTRMMR